MAQKRLSMKKNMEILRLRYELGKSEREIRTMLSLKSKTTVHRCLQRAENAGISWPLPKEQQKIRWNKCFFLSSLRQIQTKHPWISRIFTRDCSIKTLQRCMYGNCIPRQILKTTTSTHNSANCITDGQAD